ncbi:MAG: Crp/Fnr family transcriptional regulator [Bacteroidota bacterium]
MEDALLAFISQYVSLTDEETSQFLELDLISTYEKGTQLVQEGESTQLDYFVLKGCVVKYYVVDGEQKVTAIYTENEGIDSPRGLADYHLDVLEDSVLLAVDDETADRYIEKIPKFATMCRLMAEQMLSKNQLSFDQYRTATPEQRYRRLAEERPDLLQRVPQYYLASYIGIKPESLSRIRKRMAAS